MSQVSLIIDQQFEDEADTEAECQSQRADKQATTTK